MGWFEIAVNEDDIRLPAGDITINDTDTLPDLAPRYWIPATIDDQGAQDFFDSLLAWQKLPFFEGDSAKGMVPWWEKYQHDETAQLDPYVQPTVKGVDPEESAEMKLKREADQGSARTAENRMRFEKAKQDAERGRHKRAHEKVERLRQCSLIVGMPEVS